ncbi:hypothetical protein BLA29_014573, partial [Euroglyphus maynei]
MRGRKSAESSIHYNNNNEIFDNDLTPSLNGMTDQSMMINQPNNEELELLNLLEKRNRINSFMPMRGRKSMDYYYNQQQQQQQPQQQQF